MISEQEGVLFEKDWVRHGITPEEQDVILKEYKAYSFRTYYESKLPT